MASVRHRKSLNEVVQEGEITRIFLYNRIEEKIAETIVDTEDYPRLRCFRIGLIGTGYAGFHLWDKDRKKNLVFYVHRYLMDPSPGLTIDHINGDKLDNRRANLREATYSENLRNRPGTASSLVKGVYKLDNGRWMAQISLSFDTKEEAIAQRQKWEDEFHGEFAWRPE